MKITRIETHVCHARMRNWIFVKVLTDQDGLYGWGEATLEWHTRGVVASIEDISELIIGEDPRRVEHLWQMMHRQHFWHGNGIVRATAIAGIDLALWDIMGKVAGMAAKAHMGRKPRKAGGRVGADSSPLSSAHSGTPAAQLNPSPLRVSLATRKTPTTKGGTPA